MFDNFFKKPDTNTNTNSNQQQQQQQTSANGNGNQQAGTVTGQITGEGNQQQQNTQQQQQKATNPLDDFSKLYDNTASADGTPPKFAIDPTKLNEVASSLDFSKSVDPEIMTKAMGGDAKAMMDVMQSIARNSYSTAMGHMSGLSDNYINQRLEHDSKSLGSKVKEQLTQAELGNTPNYDHPTVKNFMKDTAQRLSKQFPDASPQEIATKAKSYLAELSQSVIGKPQEEATAAQKASQVTDWDEYLK